MKRQLLKQWKYQQPKKNNLPNTGSQTVNVQPTTVVTPTTAANKPEVVKSTNQVMIPKTGTQSNVSVMVL